MLLDTIKEQVTAAMKGGDKDTALTLRSIVSTLHNERIKKGDELSDEEVIKALKTEIKKRDEAYEAFKEAGREDSAANEEREKKLIQTFLPQQMSEADLDAIIDGVIKEAPDPSNFGLLMKAVMEKVGSSSDGATVSALLKKKI